VGNAERCPSSPQPRPAVERMSTNRTPQQPGGELAPADATARTADEALQVGAAGPAFPLRPRPDQQPLPSPPRPRLRQRVPGREGACVRDVGRHQRGRCRGLNSAPAPPSACQCTRPSTNNLTVPRFPRPAPKPSPGRARPGTTELLPGPRRLEGKSPLHIPFGPARPGRSRPAPSGPPDGAIGLPSALPTRLRPSGALGETVALHSHGEVVPARALVGLRPGIPCRPGRWGLRTRSPGGQRAPGRIGR
jgi:hypothetical protein